MSACTQKTVLLLIFRMDTKLEPVDMETTVHIDHLAG